MDDGNVSYGRLGIRRFCCAGRPGPATELINLMLITQYVDHGLSGAVTLGRYQLLQATAYTVSVTFALFFIKVLLVFGCG